LDHQGAHCEELVALLAPQNQRRVEAAVAAIGVAFAAVL
jgi:hypothetical protein